MLHEDPDERLSVHEADMRAAMESYYGRNHDQPAHVEMPFDEILESEDDGLEGAPSDYEMLQRQKGIEGMFRYLTVEGSHPLKIMKRLYAIGRGFRIAPFVDLTMEEAGLMFGETKAAHSWRFKFLSGKIEQCGMKGSKLAGQKSKFSRGNYSAAQQGNQNRKNGKRRK